MFITIQLRTYVYAYSGTRHKDFLRAYLCGTGTMGLTRLIYTVTVVEGYIVVGCLILHLPQFLKKVHSWIA